MTQAGDEAPSGTGSIAVIGDLVGSRQSASRAAVQQALLTALEVMAEAVPSLQRPEPTIGDEFQAVYADLPSALRASLMVRLALPLPYDCRIGFGRGGLEIVGASAYGLTQDGPAWWAARAAIDEVKRREGGRHPGLRTWFTDGAGLTSTAEVVRMTQAMLLSRDDLVSRFDARQRRLVLGLMQGRSQKALAADEGISASAVSQSLRRSGAWSVLDGLDQLDQVAP